MTDPDQLAEIKARWFGDELHHPNYWADQASCDIPWLIGEIERLRGLLRGELADLWIDLEQAIRRAHNGQWSMECDWFLDRIKTLTQQVGPAPWEQLPITLLESGLYQRTHAELGVDAPVDMARVAEVREVINKSAT